MALSALLVASTMAHNDEAKPWTFWYWMYGMPFPRLVFMPIWSV